jgi:type II secretory pathway pseudopilin PulG
MRQRLRAGEEGFSLVEMMAAIAVVMVVTTAVAVGLAASTSASAASKSRVVATNLALQDLELARSTRFTALAVGAPVTSPAQVIDNVAYTLTRTVSWRSTTSPLNRCSGGSTGRFAFKHVAVSVAWTSAGKTGSVRNETLIAPAAGEGEPDAGAQRVRVVNRDFQPLSNVQVGLTGASTPPASRRTPSAARCSPACRAVPTP